MQVASAQSTAKRDMSVLGSGELGVLSTMAVLDNEGDVSTIPEPLQRQLEICLYCVQIRMPLVEDSRSIELPGGHVVSVTPHDYHRSHCPGYLRPTALNMMLGSDSVVILGRVTFDKLGHDCNS